MFDRHETSLPSPLRTFGCLSESLASVPNTSELGVDMRIGIIGAGAMAKALGGGWAASGHEVVIGARSRAAADELAATIGHGARGGSIGEAAEFGAVALLAL